MRFEINEIFKSIQGEGSLAGSPATFIRFAGCNLKCPFCDTQHEKVNIVADEQDILREIAGSAMVVLTGGEPTIQSDFLELMQFLTGRTRGITIAVETNGSNPYDIAAVAFRPWVHVTVSPKLYNEVEARSALFASEMKFVYDESHPWEKWLERTNLPLFIQPLSGNIKPALDYVLANPKYRLSVQLHKLL